MNCEESKAIKKDDKYLSIGQILRKPVYWIKSFLATIFIIVFLIFAGKFLAIFDFIDPIGDALAGYEVTDQVFSNPKWREIPPAEDNIVVVNVGNLSRAGIAQQINIINSFEPKVIGLDLIFRNLKTDTLGDMMLANALANSPNIVVYQKLLKPDDKEGLWNDVEYSHPIFTQDHPTAFVNLVIETAEAKQYDAKTCRSFFPRQVLYDSATQKIDTVFAFAVELAKYLKPDNVDKLLARNNEEEIVNYSGNVVDYGRTRLGTRFFALDTYDVLDTLFTPDLIKDKIVLMGVMGSSFDDKYTVEDKYFTPLNAIQAGRATPDMYGVVVHANIISMILNNSYIDQMGENTSYIIAFFMLFINVLLFTIIYYKFSSWYDGVTKLLQLAQALVFVFMIILFFHLFSYKLDLTYTIILVLLAGDVLEVYYGFIMKFYCKILEKVKKK
ncbi:Adenylate cyclase [hydrothermal vent metagenome]|uniref:Adenylate cyclase n=1 Tax=hydrothermal vent metagenome TaxID=652676 RepID=A0A3B0UAC6_9ZZZZ